MNKTFFKLGAMMLRDLFLFLFHIMEKKSTAWQLGFQVQCKIPILASNSDFITFIELQ